MKRVAGTSAPAAVFFVAVSCVLAAGGVLGSDTIDTITWSPCPPQQGGTDCTTLPVLLDREDESKGTIDYFVRRFYSGQV